MIAIIHYAYGAPKSIDDLTSYFSHMLNGKPVPQPMIDQISASFLKPGFPDFIASSTQRIAKGLENLLNNQLEEQVKVYNAYKHTAPFVKDAYEQAVIEGATTIITLPINAIHSSSGGGAVHNEVAELIGEKEIRHIALNSWHLDEGITAVYADRVTRAFNWLPLSAHENAHVLFTVHSQPIEAERNKPYIKQFEELASAIANKTGIKNWHITYRSSGGKANWLAPDVKEKIKDLHDAGATGFVTCELLALSADVESYFEIGEDCQKLCESLHVPFSMAEFPGDSFDTVNALAKLVQKYIMESF
jgi:protoporphyrin/coproporphyrin ferrochelatase